MKTYTSKEILEMEDLYNLQEQDLVKYQMTQDEIQWLDFIEGKYSIADYIIENTDNDMILEIDPYYLSKVLDSDCNGAGKAVMLSDDTALQRIFFWLYQENTDDWTTI